MRRTRLLSVITAVVIIGIVVYGATRPDSPKVVNTNTTVIPKRCAEELKICPDGSPVTRLLPGCDFTACPTDGTADLTKDWKEYTSTELGLTMKYPPTWTAASGTGTATISAPGVGPLTIDTSIDDTVLNESSSHYAITVSGVEAVQADAVTTDATTRIIWIQRDGKFLRLAWKRTGNDAPYYQMVATVQLK